MNLNIPIVFIVPFRSGSKGLINKNILPLNGVPLYLHTVNLACSFSANALVFISTDYTHNELPDLPKSVNHIIRDKGLCTDDTLMSDVINDFILQNVFEESIIILLQVTSPLRTLSDVKKSIDLYKKSKFDLVMTVCETENNVLKYGMISNNMFCPIHEAKSCFENRQNLPQVYKPNGMIYVFNSSWFIDNKGFTTENLGVVKVPPERSIDIDNISDCKIAENYLKNQSKL